MSIEGIATPVRCLVLASSLGMVAVGCKSDDAPGNPAACSGSDASAATMNDAGGGVPLDPTLAAALQFLQDGRQVFRYQTFGDEAFWGDTLKLHLAIEGSANG